MSNSDVADIQAILKDIGVTTTPEQITVRLDSLKQFKVTGNEAKRSVIRLLAESAGIDLSALYKGNYTPIHVADVKEDGKWVTLRVKVVQIWDNASNKITQTGLIGDETGLIKYTMWESANLQPMVEGRSYEIRNAVTNLYIEKFQIKLNKNTAIVQLKEDVNVRQEEEFTGAIVSIQSGTGLIKRCSECNRQIKNGICGEHGKVEDIFDLRIKAVLDNGKEIRELLLDAEQTFKLTGIDLARAKEMAIAALDQNAVAQAIRDMLMGKYYHTKGNSTGRYLIVKSIAPLTTALNSDAILASVEAI
ncbi:MAG: replication factor A [Candidatus Methanoperedens nitroreducens]|uniref:Replication factor A n=1 Tax=Candidatus Methanoperedens nitratireducens TaxID=1392998 RepID=A0A0P8AHC2_9EURY|nr:MAG: replication factor A [Candidatus Methanoperedens sp. BLZ1]